MENKNSGSNFSTGFLWGALIGGGLAALLATKRGREILKEVLDSGGDIFESVKDQVKTVADPLGEVYEEEVEDAEAPLSTASTIEKEIDADLQSHNDPKNVEIQHKVRRFFKGVKKK